MPKGWEIIVPGENDEKVSRCIIITGISGSGKTTTLHHLEDQGMFAIDNIPPSLLPQLFDVLRTHKAAVEHGVAAVVDVRGEALLHDLIEVMGFLRRSISDVRLVFLDADDAELLRRFETTRRRHPLGGIPILEGIAWERDVLAPIRDIADVVLDTSGLLPTAFREKILGELGSSREHVTLIVSSFGYKYGVPKDCDFLFDVRFLLNPYYSEELRPLSGRDDAVQTYLRNLQESERLMTSLLGFLDLVLPLYGNTGKMQMHVGVGCTGGRHRSVAVAEWIGAHFREKGWVCTVRHRDIDKEARW